MVDRVVGTCESSLLIACDLFLQNKKQRENEEVGRGVMS